VRRIVALVSLAVIGVLATVAVTKLHPSDTYARAAVRAGVVEHHSDNAVSAINFDLRGIDTLGEELILFCAAIGATVLLRAQRDEGRAEQAIRSHDESRERTPGSLRAVGATLIGPVLTLGVYVVFHGQLTPGGGFQGGVILAAALLLVYAAGQIFALERVRPVDLVEVAEAVGAGAYVLIAIGGIVFGVAAMANFLPLGTPGQLLSGGTIPVLSVAVGVEVAGAMTLIITEFLDQALLRSQ
jgi:multicomponent Na+:H+ antiporter subunit B